MERASRNRHYIYFVAVDVVADPLVEGERALKGVVCNLEHLGWGKGLRSSYRCEQLRFDTTAVRSTASCSGACNYRLFVPVRVAAPRSSFVGDRGVT